MDHRGIIRSIDAEFTDNGTGGDFTHQRLVHGVDSLGNVTVNEPGWLDTAKKNRPTVSASLVDDRKYVKFTIESGNAIEPATDFLMFDLENLVNVFGFRISEPVKPGETIFLYKEEEGPHTGQISRGSRP